MSPTACVTGPKSSEIERRDVDLAEVERHAGEQLNGDRVRGSSAADDDRVDRAIGEILQARRRSR